MEHPQKGGVRSPYEQHAEDFQPRYVFAPRLVGHLACGELAIEPVLGPVRVVEVRHGEHGNDHEQATTEDLHPDNGFVHITWQDPRGPGRAIARYPAERSFDVRMPDFADRLLVRRGIDQAQWHHREITNNTARLIAAHLHLGKTSALRRFTIDGSIDEPLYDELDDVGQHRPYAREWVDALARYCLAREDTGPILPWTRVAMAEAEARAEEWLSKAGISVEALHDHANASGNGNGTDRRSRYGDLLNRKTMKTDTAVQLIEAAFTLGMETGRSRARSAAARFLIRQHGLQAAA